MSGRLLDVNALIAWEHRGSPHHSEFHAWVKRTGASDLWTCALSELGFLRVSMQVFGYTLADASNALNAIRAQAAGFLPAAPTPNLPAWVLTASQTTDGYLVQLARENGLILATFDRQIRDSSVELISRR